MVRIRRIFVIQKLNKSYIILTGSRKIDFKDKSTILNLVLIVIGIIFGLIMIIMGSLHADRSFTDSLKSGVIHTSCSLVDRCGEEKWNLKFNNNLHRN